MHLPKSTEYPAQRLNPNVNYGGLLTTCQRMFTDYDKCTILMLEVPDGEVCVHMKGQSIIRDSPCFSPNFAVILKLL